MTSKRFVKFTEEEIASFTEHQENANTKKKTVPDLKLFNEFLNSEEEERKIENIPAAELQHLAKKFVLGVRKKSCLSSTRKRPKEKRLLSFLHMFANVQHLKGLMTYSDN